jgi:hypothetical protein
MICTRTKQRLYGVSVQISVLRACIVISCHGGLSGCQVGGLADRKVTRQIGKAQRFQEKRREYVDERVYSVLPIAYSVDSVERLELWGTERPTSLMRESDN